MVRDSERVYPLLWPFTWAGVAVAHRLVCGPCQFADDYTII